MPATPAMPSVMASVRLNSLDESARCSARMSSHAPVDVIEPPVDVIEPVVDALKPLIDPIESQVVLSLDAFVERLLGFLKDFPQPLRCDRELLDRVGDGLKGGARLLPIHPRGLKACGHVRNFL